MAEDLTSPAGPAPGPYGPMYNGRRRGQVRLAAVVLITAIIITTYPRPGVHGDGLVISLALALSVVAQLATLVVPERAVAARIATELLAGAVLTGFDPGTGAVFLVYAGLDAAAFLPLNWGVYGVLSAVAVEVLATLVASKHTADGLLGLATVGGFLLGTTLRQNELRAEQAELRLADSERAERERAELSELAERANVAREVHDILAHNLGALVMQLNAANALLDGEHPNLNSLRPLLRDAHQHAVNGLKEARQAVTSLREDNAPVEVSLDDLVDTNPSASLEIYGPPRLVPANVAIVLRRTTQEALTNTAKHAPGATSSVRLDFERHSIVLTVTDTGRAQDAPPSALAGSGGGFGLVGMRERAELIGAGLSAGPGACGWQVRLTITDTTVG